MPSQSLSVLVIDENNLRASVIEAGLREVGHSNITVINDVSGLARRIVEIDPDVIVIDLENPNRDVLENMLQITRAAKRPIAMFVDKSDQTSMEAAIGAGVSAYVVDGLRKDRVKPISRRPPKIMRFTPEADEPLPQFEKFLCWSSP
jgi:response regulator NasT